MLIGFLTVKTEKTDYTSYLFFDINHPPAIKMKFYTRLQAIDVGMHTHTHIPYAYTETEREKDGCTIIATIRQHIRLLGEGAG